MDAARILIIAGASVVGVLGALHLIYTFFGRKLLPRDPGLVGAMKASSLVITRQTTVWNAWIGFNASHSLGAILFALVYVLLAAQHMNVLAQSSLVPVGFAVLLAYLWLAHAYWFRVPFAGIAIATACFAVAAVLLFL